MSQLLQETKRYRVESEEEAVALIQEFKDGQVSGNYEVKKSSYTQKTKKSKGEVVDLFFHVEVTLSYVME